MGVLSGDLVGVDVYKRQDLDRAKHGDLDFFFLCNNLSVFIQNRSLGIRVQFLLLDFLLVRCGGDDGNAMLALFYMTLKLVFPLIVSGYQSGCLLYTSSGNRPRLRYVFDISDTGTREHSRTPWLLSLIHISVCPNPCKRTVFIKHLLSSK